MHGLTRAQSSHRAFLVMDKHQLEWPPVAFASCGLWTGDGRIMVIGRDGKIGAIRRGSPVKLWETLPAPAVSISVLTSGGAAVAIMDGTLVGFSKRVRLDVMPVYITCSVS